MTAIRAQFLFGSLLLWIGIALTGFSQASIFLYLPATSLAVAGAAGFCPGVAFWEKLGLPNEPIAAMPGRKRPQISHQTSNHRS